MDVLCRTSKKLIGAGKECGGLFVLEPFNKDRRVFSCVVDPDTWHRRLGHASRDKLRGICDVIRPVILVLEPSSLEFRFQLVLFRRVLVLI